MGLSLRFLVPLIVALSVLTFASMHLVDRFVQKWSVRDLDARAELLTSMLASGVDTAAGNEGPVAARRQLEAFFNRSAAHERIVALGFCDPNGTLRAASASFPRSTGCRPTPPTDALGPRFVTLRPLPAAEGSLAIVLDATYFQKRYAEIRRSVFTFFAVVAFVVSLVTVVIAQLSWRGWVAGMRALLRRRGFLSRRRLRLVDPEIRPLAQDLRALVRQLERESGVRDEHALSWTPSALREILQRDLSGEEVLIVSNREPYIHVKKPDGKVEVQFPASGLVSALEPVMRACSGTWIAHGSGSADHETVDDRDSVAVPPGDPNYRLRRVWLTPEEEQGYYYGFANEGLWPLCHVAFTRPVFRSEDWEHYREVNRKFADAVVAEATTPNPVVLVQDYHFALVPRLLRERLPEATVILFWHIPWPNAESFGICPWREEILHGMLGASILGFHTRFHCNNFLDSVDRFCEARIDRETSTIFAGGHFTAVHQYPISIEWPPRWLEGQVPVREARRQVREELGIRPDVRIGIGVDRLDYTKGILERFRAVERLLDLEPEWREKFSFVQIASPSRSSIPAYRDFERLVREEADRINLRFGNASYRPLVLRAEHHSPFEVYRHFRAADLCFVSSLHDGMNLVAKEFVAARDDEQGVLVLSEFTGAARELPEALLVNPYDVDQCAEALKKALAMGPAECQARMRSMRSYEREFNVYRWAGRMLLDAARIRQKNRFQDKLRFGA